MRYSDVPGGLRVPCPVRYKALEGWDKRGPRGIMPRFLINAGTWMARLVAVACIGSHARSLHEVRRADLAVSPASRRSGVLP